MPRWIHYYCLFTVFSALICTIRWLTGAMTIFFHGMHGNILSHPRLSVSPVMMHQQQQKCYHTQSSFSSGMTHFWLCIFLHCFFFFFFASFFVSYVYRLLREIKTRDTTMIFSRSKRIKHTHITERCHSIFACAHPLTKRCIYGWMPSVHFRLMSSCAFFIRFYHAIKCRRYFSVFMISDVCLVSFSCIAFVLSSAWNVLVHKAYTHNAQMHMPAIAPFDVR